MQSLGDELWDVVITGTGLLPSLLALALSRSKKRVLHLDPNSYYGNHHAAFSLQEVESWVASMTQSADAGEFRPRDAGAPTETRASGADGRIFRNASIWKHGTAEGNGLSFSRAYTLALAPQIIHTRSRLLAQLVSSRAYRQVDFLAVGSFSVYREAGDDGSGPELVCIPSSREDVFSARSIPARSKRSLMKFLKFVLDFEAEEQLDLWEGRAEDSLDGFLVDEFKLDDELRKYVLALTLTLDWKISVRAGLAALNRHLTSMGLLGPGFCAVYPKWGGLSEIAQVACRAGAVGGGVYMLGTSMEVKSPCNTGGLNLELSNGINVQAKSLVSSRDEAAVDSLVISRLVAIVQSPLARLFEVTVEGAPIPAVAVIAFPGGTAPTSVSPSSDAALYATVHSSETGECPGGQSVVYLTTLAHPQAKQRLESALAALIDLASDAEECPTSLYQLYYEQAQGRSEPRAETDDSTAGFSFQSPSPGLAFDDSDLNAVKAAWRIVVGDEVPEDEYMAFEDREGAETKDEMYDD